VRVGAPGDLVIGANVLSNPGSAEEGFGMDTREVYFSEAGDILGEVLVGKMSCAPDGTRVSRYKPANTRKRKKKKGMGSEAVVYLKGFG